jgi:hypothetical protein
VTDLGVGRIGEYDEMHRALGEVRNAAFKDNSAQKGGPSVFFSWAGLEFCLEKIFSDRSQLRK